MPDDRKLDLILDSALKTYAEPSPGLEDRVLSALAEVRPPVRVPSPSRRWIMWACVLPAAACLLLFVFLIKRAPQSNAGLQPKTHQPIQTAISPVESHPSVPLHPELTHVLTHEPRRSAFPAKPRTTGELAKSIPLPKRDFFPSPQPLTPEEQALYTFATQTPEKQRQAILDAQKRDDAPLNLAAIHISPLEMPDTGKN
jgi:hypothetical protein